MVVFLLLLLFLARVATIFLLVGFLGRPAGEPNSRRGGFTRLATARSVPLTPPPRCIWVRVLTGARVAIDAIEGALRDDGSPLGGTNPAAAQ